MSPVTMIAIAAGVPLVALCIATAWLVLRPRGRAWVDRRSGRELLGAALLAVIPWIGVRFVHHFSVSIDSIGPMIGWLLVALVAFAILALLPLAITIMLIVWIVDRRAMVPR